jgi:hypothetical protein
VKYLLNWLMLFAAISILIAGGKLTEHWLTEHHASAVEHTQGGGTAGG